MEQKLDQYRGSLEMLHGVQRRLLDAGVPHDEISPAWIEYIVAATKSWLTTTSQGNLELASMLQLETYKSDNDKEYCLVNDEQGTVTDIKPEALWFMHGAVVNGKPIPAKQIQISEKERNKCDGCGIISYCFKELLDPFTERQQVLCNYCTVHHESFKVSTHGDASGCIDCSVTACSHHPSKPSKASFGVY